MQDQTPIPPIDRLARWRRHRRRCCRRWWCYLAVSLAATGLLVMNFRRGDTLALAGLAVIALLSLRGAWKTDRQIQMCNDKIAAAGRV